jgi:hypothetical protein
MLGTEEGLTLDQAANACRDSFQDILMRFAKQPEVTNFGSLRRAWNEYYFGPFAQVDKLFRDYVDSQNEQYGYLLESSICHHNLHRLFEVLFIEIGDYTLAMTRIPERIVDLVHTCRHLAELLELCASSPPVWVSGSGSV